MNFLKNFKIGNFSINEYKTFIIAEMACAHGGSFTKAKKIIDAAVKANANAVQFEIFDPDTCCLPGTDENKELHSVNFTKKQWDILLEYSKKKKIIRSIFAYDLNSLKYAIKKKVELIKFNSSDLLNIDMLNEISKTNIPLTLGTGSSNLNEINLALKFLYKKNKKIKIILMHGVQNFPTSPKNERINKIDDLKKVFNCNVGYANHTAGENFSSSFIDLAAIGKGLSIFEKHITLRRADKEFDYFSSLEPKEFKEYVKNIRFAEKVLFNGDGFKYTKSDKQYRIFQKKTIVASKEIKKGEKFSRENLIFIRNMEKEGIQPIFLNKIINRRAKKKIKKFETLKLNYL